MTVESRRTLTIRRCAVQESGTSVSEWQEEPTSKDQCARVFVRGCCVFVGVFAEDHEWGKRKEEDGPPTGNEGGKATNRGGGKEKEG